MNLLIAPRARVLAQLVVGHAVEIRAQVEAGLVHALVGRILLEIPGGLLHGQFLHDRRRPRRGVLDQLDRHLVRAFDEGELDAAVGEAARLGSYFHAVVAHAREGSVEVVDAEAEVIDDAAARRDERAAASTPPDR